MQNEENNNENKYEISVVIPCLNEENTVGLCIKKAIEALKKHNIKGEIIIADNGSNDNSVKIALEFNSLIKSENTDNYSAQIDNIVKVVNCPEKGYGNAIRNGVEQAQGKYILMGDADDTYDFSTLNEFYQAAIKDENIQMVIGSRFKGEIENGAMPFLNRYIGNPALTFLVNILFGSNLSDSQCGLRLFKKSAYNSVKFIATGMEFATEIIVEFLLNKFKIVEIPTKLYKDKEGRKPHLRKFRDGTRNLILILKKRFFY